MRKLRLSLVGLMFGTALAMAGTSAHALPCDALGSNWQGRIDLPGTIWSFELRRRTCAAASPWNYYLWSTTSRMEGEASVSITGASLLVTAVSGGASGCVLSGTYYRRDVTNGLPYRGAGSASCGGAGSWQARIR